jgi:hypothetical protein
MSTLASIAQKVPCIRDQTARVYHAKLASQTTVPNAKMR